MRRNNHGMMNDSLQIRDLDRELALLRRKRELIEEQQQLLNRPIGHNISPWADPQSNYDNHNNQQRYIQPDVVNMYDSRFSARPESRKRPADGAQPWEPAPKRFDRPAPRRRDDSRRQQRFNDRPAPKQQQARNNFSNKGPRSKPNYGRKPSPPPNRQFSAPKPNGAPKPAGRPAAGRAGPAGAGAAGRPGAGAAPYEEPVLRADEALPPAVAGRMELALGDVYAAVRAAHSHLSPQFFNNHAHGKIMKQAIRSRIKSALMGKPVGSRTAIVSAYWEAFPEARDVVRLVPGHAAGEEPRGNRPPPQQKIKNPVQVITHLKQNAVKLLECQLDEMFKKLETLYEGEEIGNQIDVLKEIIKTESKDLEKIEDIEVKTDAVDTDAAKNTDEKTDEAKNTDEKTDEAKNTNEKTDDVEAETAVTETDNTDSAKADNAEVEKTEETKAEETPTEVSKPETEEKMEVDTEFDQKVQSLNGLYEKLFCIIFRHKVKALLPRFRGALLEIIKSEKSKKEGEALLEAREKETQVKKTAESNKEVTQGGGKTPTVAKDIPYFVAVVGRPKLPKRAKLSKFLWQFNPLSIKKPKNIFNILFVGLGDQKDYDAILAASGANLLGCTLTIKPSEKSKKQNIDASTPAAEEENASFSEDITIIEDRDGDISINSDIENKIDDILNSVRTVSESQEEELLKDTEEIKADTVTGDNQDNMEHVEDEVEKTEKTSEEATEDSKVEENGEEKTAGEENGEGETAGEENGKVETVGEETGEEVKEPKPEKPAPVRATRRTSRLANK